jgi:hypothetical protein
LYKSLLVYPLATSLNRIETFSVTLPVVCLELTQMQRSVKVAGIDVNSIVAAELDERFL